MAFRILPLLLLVAVSTHAQNWSVGAGAGPFVFGDFVERTLLIESGESSDTQTLRLSAATSPGFTADLERRLSDRFAVRLEGTFTRSPLEVRGDDSDGVTLDAGEIDVTTFALPIVYTINRRGSFRFHVAAGPAYASYRIERDDDDASTIRVFTGTRSAWGLSLGGGVSWHWSERFSLEGKLTDVATASPFRREDFPALNRIRIERPHNIHTSAGIRYRF